MKKHSTSARWLITILAGGTLLGASTAAKATVIDFEGLVLNQSVNGQAGWTVEDEFGNGRSDIGQPAFDEEVVDDGTGNTVWRVSNAVTTSGFSDQPYSQTTTAAGESGSALWNDRGSDHTMPLSPPDPGAAAGSSSFHSSFRFKSATGAAQAGLSINVSASAKQSTWRNSYINIVDDGVNGFDVTFYETGTAADPFGATAISTLIASDLPYADWHTIEFYIQFMDGLEGDTTGNDVVSVLVDGMLVHTGSTWESYYNGSNPAGLNPGDQPQRQAVDSVIFNLRGTAAPGTAGNGLFIDDVLVDNASLTDVPEPATLALFGIGLAGLGFARRRKKTA